MQVCTAASREQEHGGKSITRVCPLDPDLFEAGQMGHRRLPAQSLQTSTVESQWIEQTAAWYQLKLLHANYDDCAPDLALRYVNDQWVRLTDCFQRRSVFIIQQHKVAWFDIPVQDAVRMTLGKRTQDSPHETSNLRQQLWISAIVDQC